jgi:hypothetical protein
VAAEEPRGGRVPSWVRRCLDVDVLARPRDKGCWPPGRTARATAYLHSRLRQGKPQKEPRRSSSKYRSRTRIADSATPASSQHLGSKFRDVDDFLRFAGEVGAEVRPSNRPEPGPGRPGRSQVAGPDRRSDRLPRASAGRGGALDREVFRCGSWGGGCRALAQAPQDAID